MEPAVDVGGGDGPERLGDGGVEHLLAPRADAPEAAFELAEGLLDRRKIGRVGGEKDEVAADRFDIVPNRLPLVGAQGIENHDLPRDQAGAEEVADKDREGVPGDRAVEGQGGLDACRTESRQDRGVLGVVPGH